MSQSRGISTVDGMIRQFRLCTECYGCMCADGSHAIFIFVPNVLERLSLRRP
jgi:hypothetical protein